MNMRKSLFLLMLVLSVQAFGQALVTQFDKKVIYPDSLNLPRNTSAMTVITSLPELLQRPGDYILNNYDVQVDGMTIGSAVDVALSQLQVMDIDFIEVCESPVTSHFKNGQGGSINFVLRSKGGEKGKPWGRRPCHERCGCGTAVQPGLPQGQISGAWPAARGDVRRVQ